MIKIPAIPKKLILAAAILVLLIGVFGLPHPRSATPLVDFDFLTFTNSGGRVEALFALTNPPNAAVSLETVRAVAHSERKTPAAERGHFSWARRETWGLAYAIGIDTTNEPLKVVLRFQQRAAGPKRIIEQIRELAGKITHHEREFFTGQVFFVTNETRIAEKQP